MSGEMSQRDPVRSPIYPLVAGPVALALVASMRLPWVLGAERKAHGQRSIYIAAAKDPRMDDDYYYFGFETEEARVAANERILVRIAEIKAEDRKKPHALIVDGIHKRSRWLTLATGTFPSDTRKIVPVGGGAEMKVLIYPFDTAEEVERAMARVKVCPEFTADITLGHWQAETAGTGATQ